jgi:hypothetical protein
MLVAKIDNPMPIDYREAFPNTSFPSSGPSDSFLSENGWAKVNVFKPHDFRTQKLVPTTPYYEEPWVHTVAVENKTQDELNAETNGKAEEVREQRNKLLASSDWTQLSDSPLNSLQKADWLEYRNELRNIPEQQGFPWEVVWPTQP